MDLESDAGVGGGEAPRSSAEGAREVGCGDGVSREGVSPSPLGDGSGEGAQKFFKISELKWCVLVHFTRKNSDTIGLEKTCFV